MAIIRWKPGAVPEPWRGVAIFWHDGDTLKVLNGPVRSCVRLYGIDAPEWGQEGDRVARDRLRALTERCRVSVYPRGLDRYGRIVAVILTETCGDVAERLLREGLVWHEYRFAAEAKHYASFQKDARAAQVGLWARRPYGFAPWVFRSRGRRGD